jgi:hypothetical protein
MECLFSHRTSLEFISTNFNTPSAQPSKFTSRGAQLVIKTSNKENMNMGKWHIVHNKNKKKALI